MLETYEVDDTTRKMKRVNELTLYKDEQNNRFKGSRKSYDNGYLAHGSIACNGNVLLFHSNHYMHVFDCGTGVRRKKEHYNSTSLISTYCTRSNYYFHMDAACYSWLKKFKLSGFKPRDLTKKDVKELPDLPVVLEQVKKDIESSCSMLGIPSGEFFLILNDVQYQ